MYLRNDLAEPGNAHRVREQRAESTTGEFGVDLRRDHAELCAVLA
jgi:hypothetical protein